MWVVVLDRRASGVLGARGSSWIGGWRRERSVVVGFEDDVLVVR
jgi:hypothetical protein